MYRLGLRMIDVVYGFNLSIRHVNLLRREVNHLLNRGVQLLMPSLELLELFRGLGGIFGASQLDRKMRKG